MIWKARWVWLFRKGEWLSHKSGAAGNQILAVLFFGVRALEEDRQQDRRGPAWTSRGR